MSDILEDFLIPPTERVVFRDEAPSKSDDVDHPADAIREAGIIASSPISPFCGISAVREAPDAADVALDGLVRIRTPDGHGWALRHRHGEVQSPIYATEAMAPIRKGLVLDVYAGLLLELSRAGYPSDGRVRIGRYEFLRRIGWQDPQSGAVPGRNYALLDEAIEYLAAVRLRSTAIERFVALDDVLDSSGVYTFRILQGFGLVSRRQGVGEEVENRDEAGNRADDLVVDFATPFVRLMANDRSRTVYRLSDYLSFDTAVGRALFRFVMALQVRPLMSGAITLDVDEVLGAIGSKLRGVPGAKLRQTLGSSPAQLVAKGFLRKEPKYSRERVDGRIVHRVMFCLGTPPTADLEKLLYETLVAYGVTGSVAKTCIANHAEWVATVVAATTLGMLRVQKTLPSMVVDYCTHPQRVLDDDLLPRFRPSGNQPPTAIDRDEMEYLQESFDDSQTYFDGLRPSDQRKQRAKFSAPGRPEWVRDGLVLAAMRQARSGWTLAAFLTSRGIRPGGNRRRRRGQREHV